MKFSYSKQKELRDFFSSILGHYTYFKNQDEHLFDCPVCNKHKLSVNFVKGVGHCWYCPSVTFGSVRKFIKDYFPSYLPECVKILKGEGFEDGLFDSEESEEAQEEVKVELPPEFQAFNDNMYNRLAVPYGRYLVARGIGEETALRYNMGFCIGGRYDGRVVIPSYDKQDKLNYFIGRAIYGHIDPPYLNPHIPKMNTIFNEKNIDWRNMRGLIICEGIFDLLALEKALGTSYGYTLLLGKTLTPDNDLWTKILEYDPVVYLGLDHDARENADQTAHQLTYWGIDTYICIAPKDYGDYGNMLQRNKIDEMRTHFLNNANKYDIL